MPKRRAISRSLSPDTPRPTGKSGCPELSTAHAEAQSFPPIMTGVTPSLEFLNGF